MGWQQIFRQQKGPNQFSGVELRSVEQWTSPVPSCKVVALTFVADSFGGFFKKGTPKMVDLLTNNNWYVMIWGYPDFENTFVWHITCDHGHAFPKIALAAPFKNQSALAPMMIASTSIAMDDPYWHITPILFTTSTAADLGSNMDRCLIWIYQCWPVLIIIFTILVGYAASMNHHQPSFLSQLPSDSQYLNWINPY